VLKAMQLELPAGRAQVKALGIICCNETRTERLWHLVGRILLSSSNRRRCRAELCMIQTIHCYNTQPCPSIPVPSQFKRNIIFPSIRKKCIQRRMLVLPYVCMYVRTYVCIYCMYVCMYVFIVCMHVCTYVYMHFRFPHVFHRTHLSEHPNHPDHPNHCSIGTNKVKLPVRFSRTSVCSPVLCLYTSFLTLFQKPPVSVVLFV